MNASKYREEIGMTMKIMAKRSKTVVEDVVSRIVNHSRIPTWYAMKKEKECSYCNWEYKAEDEIEIIEPEIGFTMTMHTRCFMKSVNAASK